MGFPYTISAETKLADLQILKPEETKMIRPVDIAAFNLLREHDDVVTYINALMLVERPEDNQKSSGAQPQKIPELQKNTRQYKNGF